MVRVCRWGILSTAEIGKKNWQAIANAGNATIMAVASRNAEKSQAFIDHCQQSKPIQPAPVAYGSYEELIDDENIDAVYIPLPTGLRHKWVIEAANAGKHVMCEKPCSIDSHHLREMIETCEKNNVQFMDGVMYMHTNRLAQLRKVLDDGHSVGDIRRIGMHFSFNGGEEFEASNIRTNADLEPHGCLGDLGWYTIRFALWAMNYEMPTRVSARILRDVHRADSPSPTPLEFSAELHFNNGATASFYNSFVTHHQQWAVVAGTKGFLHVPDFVLPYLGNSLGYSISQADFKVTGCDFVMENHLHSRAVPEYSNSSESAQETKLFRNFSNLVLAGEVDPHWPEIALKTQQVLDLCFASANENGVIKDVVV